MLSIFLSLPTAISLFSLIHQSLKKIKSDQLTHSNIIHNYLFGLFWIQKSLIYHLNFLSNPVLITPNFVVNHNSSIYMSLVSFLPVLATITNHISLQLSSYIPITYVVEPYYMVYLSSFPNYITEIPLYFRNPQVTITNCNMELPAVILHHYCYFWKYNYIPVSTSPHGLRFKPDILVSIHGSDLDSCPHIRKSDNILDSVYNCVLGTQVSATT